MGYSVLTFKVAGWDAWLIVLFAAGTLVVANLLAKLSTSCKKQRIQSLATKLATDDKKNNADTVADSKTPITIVTGFLGSGM